MTSGTRYNLWILHTTYNQRLDDPLAWRHAEQRYLVSEAVCPLHCDLALSGLPWAWDSGRSPDLSVAIAEIKSQARPYILADPSSPPTDCTTLTKAFSINHP